MSVIKKDSVSVSLKPKKKGEHYKGVYPEDNETFDIWINTKKKKFSFRGEKAGYVIAIDGTLNDSMDTASGQGYMLHTGLRTPKEKITQMEATTGIEKAQIASGKYVVPSNVLKFPLKFSSDDNFLIVSLTYRMFSGRDDGLDKGTAVISENGSQTVDMFRKKKKEKK